MVFALPKQPSFIPIVLKQAAIVFLFGLFLKCYFPTKKSLQGNAKHYDRKSDSIFPQCNINTQDSESLTKQPWNHAHFRKFHLVLIDALREDFVFGDKSPMSFVKKLQGEGHALSFTATVHPPTVTLPRIKVNELISECSVIPFFLQIKYSCP